MTQIPHPHTPAGVSDDGFSAETWRTTAATWLIVVAVGMSLPRISSLALWTSLAAIDFDVQALKPILNALQGVWLGASVVGLMALRRLSVLDTIEEAGAPAKVRRAAVMVGTCEVGVRLVALVGGTSLWMLSSALSVATEVLVALWLMRILRHAGRGSVLLQVVAVDGALALTSVVPWQFRLAAGLVATVWLMVDVLRARRALA